MAKTKLKASQVNEDTIQDKDNDTRVTVEEASDEDKIRFDTAGTERMIITNAGAVGIGTSSPDNTLHVKSPGTTHIKIESEAGHEAALKLKSGTESSVYVWQPGNTSDLRFYVNGADRVHVDNTGNVGIATTDPLSTLSVNGSISRAITTKTANYTATGSDSTILIDAGSSSVTITLPAVSGTAGRIYTIKCIAKGGGNAANLATNSSEQIDGSSNNIILNNNQSVIIQSSGSAWYKIAEFMGDPP